MFLIVLDVQPYCDITQRRRTRSLEDDKLEYTPCAFAGSPTLTPTLTNQREARGSHLGCGGAAVNMAIVYSGSPTRRDDFTAQNLTYAVIFRECYESNTAMC